MIPIGRRAVFSVLLLAMVACGGGGQGRSEADGGQGRSDGDDIVARRPLVALVRYGGADGGNARVEVGSTGEAVVTSDLSPVHRAQVLSATDFSSLRNALERSQIATLQRNYLDPLAEIAFQYDVTYQGVTVTADAGVMPRQLQPVVGILDKLLG